MTRTTATKSLLGHHSTHLSDVVPGSLESIEGWSRPGRESVRPLLLGHRGARPISRSDARAPASVPPENSLACFEYALTNGCDGFEFDVRVTRDGQLVICHNAWVKGFKVSASSYDRLQSHGPFCSLEEVLRRFAHRAYLDVEVKVAGAEDAIVAAVHRHRPERGFVISSFLPEVLRRLHKLDSSLPLGYVCKRSSSLPLLRRLPIQLVLPHYKLVTRELIEQAHDRGLQIFTWTVNREPDLLQLADWGVDGVISDDPRLLAQTLGNSEALAKG